jgi:hypothetical protein
MAYSLQGVLDQCPGVFEALDDEAHYIGNQDGFHRFYVSDMDLEDYENKLEDFEIDEIGEGRIETDETVLEESISFKYRDMKFRFIFGS